MAKSAASKSAGGGSAQDKATSVGSIGSDDKARICALLADLIKIGADPPVTTGNMWDSRQLAKWYARCAGLSAWLSASLGEANVWKSTLTSGDATKLNDRQFHTAMLGTLDAIQEFVECT